MWFSWYRNLHLTKSTQYHSYFQINVHVQFKLQCAGHIYFLMLVLTPHPHHWRFLATLFLCAGMFVSDHQKSWHSSFYQGEESYWFSVTLRPFLELNQTKLFPLISWPQIHCDTTLVVKKGEKIVDFGDPVTFVLTPPTMGSSIQLCTCSVCMMLQCLLRSVALRVILSNILTFKQIT